MDNLSSHKTKKVWILLYHFNFFTNMKIMIWMQENFYQVIFNIVRNPDYNCIETIFNQIKKHFKEINDFKKENLIKNIHISI